MNYKYANISLDLPIFNEFTYSIPDSLKGSIAIGCRVTVPFRNKKCTGFIVELKTDIDETIKSKLKDIINIKDPYPALNNELLKLTKWISKYYEVPLGEVLNTAIPKEAKKKLLKFANLTKSSKELSNEKLTLRQKKIIDLLSKSSMSVSAISKIVASPYTTIKSLANRGIIEVSNCEIFRTPENTLKGSSTKIEIEDFSSSQSNAYNMITSLCDKKVFNTILVHGITGSGKTEVYIHTIDYVVKSGKEALVLVPEIALTPQLIERFKLYFGENISVLHSGLGVGERYDEWRRIKEKKVKIAIGTRSAIFAPFDNLGVIIIDEEHDSSYKQAVMPCYNGRDAAVIRGKFANAVVILGSATPSLESFYNYETGKYKYASLNERAKKSTLPNIRVVDTTVKKESFIKNFMILSKDLVDAVRIRLKNNEQSLLFLNRRGSAPFIQCSDCGFVYKCKNCSVSMTFHSVTNSLVCHYCEHTFKPHNICPDCKGYKLKPLGYGTQKIEIEIKKFFPKARVLRMDKDTVSGKDYYATAINKLRSNEVDILIGTQMVTKGHDFPNVTLVGVIYADMSLNIPDFRAGERTFHIITQVSGRAGRREKKGEVIIQTKNPAHYSIECARVHNYENFYKNELKFRKILEYPPFSRIISIKIESIDETKGELFIQILKENMHSLEADKHGVSILGPSKAVLYKIKNRYRWQIMLKSKNINSLKRCYRTFIDTIEKKKMKPSGLKIMVDVDPQDFM